MESNRIYFEGNPWPEGHPIKELYGQQKRSTEKCGSTFISRRQITIQSAI
ncbi:UNVERIFIED_ORG: hypothetical protein QE446_004636 [Rhizobium sp. SORGH_AS260]|nr:hypothetical protein [Rhizobium sp. SORGH_AS_0285]MDP9756712.1 hypothetical protein [Rhizobium sp. SORGH_AS_0260]MDR6084038.1 hypothetical protein [Agrobacterium sp. SORGH_AS_0440]